MCHVNFSSNRRAQKQKQLRACLPVVPAGRKAKTLPD
jgi:hypothetical protein